MATRHEQSIMENSAAPAAQERTSHIVGLRDEGFLLWEIADRIGVTKERVRQILARAKARGQGPQPPKQLVTRQASILLGMPLEMRPGSFQRLMARFGVTPAVVKRGRLYWSVEALNNLKLPVCGVCNTPIPLSRYTRSDTCSSRCSTTRRLRTAN